MEDKSKQAAVPKTETVVERVHEGVVAVGEVGDGGVAVDVDEVEGDVVIEGEGRMVEIREMVEDGFILEGGLIGEDGGMGVDGVMVGETSGLGEASNAADRNVLVGQEENEDDDDIIFIRSEFTFFHLSSF